MFDAIGCIDANRHFFFLKFLIIALVYSLFVVNFASWVSEISKCDNIFVNKTKKVVKNLKSI